MKKKVLIVVESLACGGGEKSLVSMLPELDYKSCEVDLLICNRGGLFEKLVDQRVKILPTLPFVDFCNQSIQKQLFSFNFSFLFPRVKWAFAIRNSENKGRHPSEVYWENCKSAISSMEKEYDVAIAWGQGHATHYVAEKVLAKRKYAWINADYVLGKHDKEFDRPLYAKMDGIVVVSDRLLPITQEVFPEFKDKMQVIYDIVNADLIKKMANLEVVLSNDKGIKLVTAGRLEPPKGYDLAVEACRLLKEKGIEFTWYIVGEGSQRAMIEKKIEEYHLEDYFVLLGMQSNPYLYIDKADVYIQTSVFEGYCLTLAEARILNKPIVSTNFDVVYDQIQNGINGLIVDKKPEAIADGVVKLLDNDALRKRMIEALQKEKKGNTEDVLKIMSIFEAK